MRFGDDSFDLQVVPYIYIYNSQLCKIFGGKHEQKSKPNRGKDNQHIS